MAASQGLNGRRGSQVWRTGADLLSDFMEVEKQSQMTSALLYLRQLAQRWGYADFEAMDQDSREKAVIAFPFAQIKAHGSCTSEARDLALGVLEQQRIQLDLEPHDPLRQERINAIQRNKLMLDGLR